MERERERKDLLRVCIQQNYSVVNYTKIVLFYQYTIFPGLQLGGHKHENLIFS